MNGDGSDSVAELCCICRSGAEPGDATTWTLECGHRFHTSCIMQWFRSDISHGQCPLCRGLSHKYVSAESRRRRIGALREMASRGGASRKLRSTLLRMDRCNVAHRRAVESEKSFASVNKAIFKKREVLRYKTHRADLKRSEAEQALCFSDFDESKVPLFVIRESLYDSLYGEEHSFFPDTDSDTHVSGESESSWGV